MINEYIERVESAIEKAKLDSGTKLSEEIFKLPGMSTRENRILLNELVKSGDRYLEIGVHKGSTFVSAMYQNDAYGIAIDNFSQFGGQEIKIVFDQHCTDHNIQCSFINHDCFNLNDEHKNLLSNINVYFYDGDHRHEDQEKALTYYFDFLTNPFIFIVDDWNHKPAVDGTRSGIEKTGAIVHKEWILDGNTTKKSWHNGLYVAVLGKP